MWPSGLSMKARWMFACHSRDWWDPRLAGWVAAQSTCHRRNIGVTELQQTICLFWVNVQQLRGLVMRLKFFVLADARTEMKWMNSWSQRARRKPTSSTWDWINNLNKRRPYSFNWPSMYHLYHHHHYIDSASCIYLHTSISPKTNLKLFAN